MNTRDILGIIVIVIIMTLVSIVENPKQGISFFSKIQKGISNIINSLIRWINRL